MIGWKPPFRTGIHRAGAARTAKASTSGTSAGAKRYSSGTGSRISAPPMPPTPYSRRTRSRSICPATAGSTGPSTLWAPYWISWSSAAPLLLSESLRDEHGVGAAEGKGVRHYGFERRPLACLVGHIVEIALGIRFGIVAGGGDGPRAQRHEARDHFDRAGGSHQMSVQCLGRAHRDGVRGVPERFLECRRFDNIADLCGGSVGVDVSDVRRRHARIRDRPLQRLDLAIQRWLGYVGRVASDPVASKLAPYPRRPGAASLVGFEHQDRGTFAENEPRPPLRKRPARTLGVGIVRFRKDAHCRPRADHARGGHGFRSAGDRDVYVSVPYGPERFADCHGGRSACDGVGHHGAANSKADRKMRCRRVGHGGYDGYRRNAAVVLVEEARVA